MKEMIKLLKNALTGEVIAQNFYALASDMTTNSEASKIFRAMSIMEGDHSETILEKFVTVSNSAQFDGQIFLDDCRSQNDVYVQHSSLIRNSSPKQALEFALSFENKAKDNYEKLAEVADDPKLKKLCLELAADEAKHVQQIEYMLNSLDKWEGTLFLNTRTR